MAGEFERDHGVARFLKKIAELAGGIFAALCAANASCDLFPVGHRELCGGIVAVTGGNLPATERKTRKKMEEARREPRRVPVLARCETVTFAELMFVNVFTH